MANTEGGTIVLGGRETERKVRLDVLDLVKAEQYQRDLWNTLNNKGKVSANLLRNEDIKVFPVGNSVLLSIRVPRASRSQRPIYLNGNPFGNTFRRNYEGDYHCTDPEIRRMFADAEEIPPDQRILEGFGLEDLDLASLTQYRQRVRAAKGDHPWLGLNDIDLLERLQGWRKNRSTKESGLTFAGLIMFGRGDALRDPNAAPNFFPDYREKLDAQFRWTDRVYPDGTWESNLFQFYQRVWPKLASGLPLPFKLEKGMRRDETPAHEALREAFVNALIHADYAAPGSVVIERAPDRFVLENPGILLVSMEQFRRGGVSECRNKALQQMFLLMGCGERAGSGADRIRFGWKSRHWRTPLLTTTTEPNRVRLELPMVSLIPAETHVALERLFGSARMESLSPDELQAVATAQIEGFVSNGRLRELLDMHPMDITRLFQSLCEHGFLVSNKRKRWTIYELKGEGRQPDLFDSQHLPGDSQHLPGDSQHLPGDSQHLPGDAPHLAGDSQHLPGDSQHLPGDAPHLPGDAPHLAGDSQHLPGDSQHLIGEQTVLENIAGAIAATKKSPPTEVRQVILALCQGRFLRVKEIAKLLNRSPSGIQQRFVGPLVQEGKLCLKYPAEPNRPDQAYTTGHD